MLLGDMTFTGVCASFCCLWTCDQCGSQTKSPGKKSFLGNYIFIPLIRAWITLLLFRKVLPKELFPSKGSFLFKNFSISLSRGSFLFLFFFFFCLFRVAPAAYGGSQARGRIRAIYTGLSHSHSKTGSKQCLWPTPQLTAMLDPLTHWARPGIEPESSWTLIRFASSEPWWEFHTTLFFIGIKSYSMCLNTIILNFWMLWDCSLLCSPVLMNYFVG